MNLYSITWGVRHGGIGGSYVVESADGHPITTYGPMPAATTGAFVLERQAAVRKVFDRVIDKLNREYPRNG